VLKHGSGPPVWVIVSAGLAIALGTYVGGWRIIRTMGSGLTDVQSPQGFAAGTAATTVILASTHMGFALSTTHVSSGGILGAGLGRRLAEVRWGVAGRMVLAWVFTLPAAALVGGVSAAVAKQGTFGVVVICAVAIAIAVAAYTLSRRNPIDAENVNEAEPAPVLTAA